VEHIVRNVFDLLYSLANPQGRPAWLRYGAAVVCVALAVIATLLAPEIRAGTPLLFFFPAIIFSAVFGGLLPGLVAVCLAAVAINVWVLPDGNVADLLTWQLVETTAFVVVAVAIVLLVGALQRARSKLLVEREELQQALAAAAMSEDRFRVAQELSLDGFTILSAVREAGGSIVDFRWQYVNPKAAEILKLPRAALEGKQLLQLLPGNHTNSELFARYVSVVETGRPHDIEIAYDADGIQGWFRNMAVKLGDGVAVSFSDISERKDYERQLSYQAFLLENVSDAVFAFDQDLRITLWNHGAEELYGWSAAEAIGRPAGEVVRTAATPEQAQANVAQVEAGQKRHFEAIHHNRAGDLIYIDSTATPIRGEENAGERAARGYVVINRDMTARKRYEEELQRLNATLEQRVQERTAELERSNRELDQFAYVASHDLKAPLRAIALLSEWITEDAAPVLPPASLAHLTKLNGRVRRMDKLLNDLLDYSRAGRVRDVPELVDTRQLLQSTVELLALPEGFTVLLPEAMPVIVTERVPLETVLRNLLQNAGKHHHDPQHGCVSVTAEDQGEAILFTVRDNGPGIPLEYHDRIFKLFQTLQPRDQVEGSGMGLSVVKKTVESRGGSVRLASEAGTGAAFSFTWPKQPSS
jgi:PAS domain S-box-containing protein